MGKPASIERPAPDWSAYDHAPAAWVSHCCLLLMGLRPAPAIKAGVTKWPTRSELGKRYNSLLSACYKGMIAKNPLLQPLEGEVTKDRTAFQRLQISVAHFAALARSDLSPFAYTLQKRLPDGFGSLKAPIPVGSKSSTELLAELRSTYPSDGESDDTELLDAGNLLDALPKGKDKQLLLYSGAVLRWAYESLEKEKWHYGSGLSASAIEVDLLAWMRERLAVPDDAPREGTMRKHLGMAVRAFDNEYRLKRLK